MWIARLAADSPGIRLAGATAGYRLPCGSVGNREEACASEGGHRFFARIDGAEGSWGTGIVSDPGA
ncbi:hypothetical protein D1872_334220 [compost metagenome]